MILIWRLDSAQFKKRTKCLTNSSYVAILTTPGFDALKVDASTLELGDPNLNGAVAPTRNRAKDVDGDGDMDMALSFPLCKLVNRRALSTSSTELVLTGSTLDGVSFTGRDSVKVVREDWGTGEPSQERRITND